MNWLALIAGATLAGMAAVALLTVPRRAEPLAGAVVAASLGWSMLGLLGVVRTNGRAEVVFAAALLGVASLATGYMLAAALLPLLGSRPRGLPIAGSSREDPRTGVIVLADAEPERYSPSVTAREVTDLGDAEGHVAPTAISPFLFASEKARYRTAGGRSPARDTVRAIVRRTGETLGDDEYSEPLVAYATGSPSLTECVAALARSGHRCVVVCPLGVAEGRPQELAKRVLDSAAPASAGVRVEYAPSLWTSDLIAELVASRVLRASAGVEPTTGVALVVHGQPPAWSRDFPDQENHEVAFCHRVRALLLEGGLAEQNLRLAWDSWREPDVPEVGRHLAAIGCARVFVVPACDPVDSLATLFDLQHAVDFARVSVPARVMPAWNDAPEVARALAESVPRALRESSPG